MLNTFNEAPLERAVASAYGKHLVNTPEFGRFVRRATVASWDNVETSFRRLIFEASIGDEAGRERLHEEFAAGTDVANLRGWLAKVGGLGKPAVAGFSGLFEGLKPVYVHRNGVDTVQSRTQFGPFAKQTFESNCEKWAKGLGLLRLLEQNSDVIVVRHEELLNDAEGLFTQILGELGLDEDPAPAQYALNTARHPTQDLDDEQTIAEHFETRAEAHGSWNDEQKRIFLDICGKAMDALGYEIPFA